MRTRRSVRDRPQARLRAAVIRQAYALGHRIELVALSDMRTVSTRTYCGVIGTIYSLGDVRAITRISRSRSLPIHTRMCGLSSMCGNGKAGMEPAIKTLVAGRHRIVAPVGHRVVHLLRELRFKPGTDVSALAHEMPDISEFCNPPLTTIERDFDQLTATALELLESDRVRKRRVDYRFHERERVATPKLTEAAPARGV